MIITTSKSQREISRTALTLSKTLAQHVQSSLRRLTLPEAPILSTLGQIEVLQTEFARAPESSFDEIAFEVSVGAAKVWRVSLAIWTARAIDRSDAAKQLNLLTNIGDREDEAQKLYRQLSDVLELPFDTITAFDAKPPRENAGKPRRTGDTNTTVDKIEPVPSEAIEAASDFLAAPSIVAAREGEVVIREANRETKRAAKKAATDAAKSATILAFSPAPKSGAKKKTPFKKK
jgi:hypothetical protein